MKLKRRLSLIESMFPRLTVIRAAIMGDSIMYKMNVSPDGVSPQTDHSVIVSSRFYGIGLRVDTTQHD